MEHFINSVKLSLQTRNWYSALTLSLTLPDICAKIEYPNLNKSSQKRYAFWFDKYVGEQYKMELNGNIHTFMTGNDCYALRCSFLHEGTNKVSHQRAKELVSEKFIIMYSDFIQIHKCGTDKLTIFLTNFCIDIINGVETWLNDLNSDSDRTRIDEVNKLMKIYLPDFVDKNGNSRGAIIKNLQDET